MNKPTRDRFFPIRAACYKLNVTGEGIKPSKESKVAIPIIDFKKVDYIEESEEGTIIGMSDGTLFEVKLDYSIVNDAHLRYKNSIC